MIHQCITSRSLSSFTLLFFFVLSICAVASSQITASADSTATAFSVKAYGATGQGKADDTSAIQRAIDAATAANGGIVFFPEGTYLVNGTLHNKRADLVSLAGSGMASRLIVNSAIGIIFESTNQSSGTSGFHSGRIQDLYIKCGSQNNTAIQMTDMIAVPSLIDLSISRCNTAFHLINEHYWNERLMAQNISDDYNNHLFHFDQNPKTPTNSFGYGIYSGIYINKDAGQDVFYLTGGAYIYHSTFDVKGNLIKAKGASIFNLQGKSSDPCSGIAFNVYDIAVEGENYFVVNSNPNGCRPGSTGNALVEGHGNIHLAGATALASPGSLAIIHDSRQASYLAVPIYTATDSLSDTVSSASVTPSSKCFVQPTEAISAKAMTQTYVSGTNWQSITITHPASARGGRFQVWCSP